MVSYDELSQLLGDSPDLMILRRFGPLAAQVLLHMQADLLAIDEDLRDIKEYEEKATDPSLRQHSRSWSAATKDMKNGEGSERLEKVVEAEDKLLRYCQSREPDNDHAICG